MEEEQYRSLIRLLSLKQKTRSEIEEGLDVVNGDSYPSMTTVKSWFIELQRGRTSTFDEEDNMKKVYDLALTDRRFDLIEIWQTEFHAV